MSASSPALSTSPEPMRTWKIDGPPEIVDGMVMKVMTSCSLRPARRAKKPPIAWMPSCEFPAIRITASETLDTLGLPSGAAVKVALLIDTTPVSGHKLSRTLAKVRSFRLKGITRVLRVKYFRALDPQALPTEVCSRASPALKQHKPRFSANTNCSERSANASCGG